MRSIVAVTVVVSALALGGEAQTKSPVAQGFDRLKALKGEWVDVDGTLGTKGTVVVKYEVTSGGHTVVETFPANTPHEMVTVYHIDGNELALTHYCTSNTQPRMRSTGLNGNTLTFDYAGGANIDAAKTSHMHGATFEFVSADELRATWHNWEHGKLDHSATFRVIRKK